MRVLKPEKTDDEVRLVAAMLNIEKGALAVGPNLEPLPPPHEPHPVVKMDPITARGVPYVIHYRSTVGVVYYTLTQGSHIAALIGRLAAQLDRAGDAHLRGYRAVAATPTTVLRHKMRVAPAGGSMVVGPQKCHKKAIVDNKAGLPARLLHQWLPPNDGSDIKPPPHYSVGAAFTWVFMPVTAALAMGEIGFDSMPAVNASLSAIFYDGGQTSNIPDGGEIALLTPNHFDVVGLPDFLRLPPHHMPRHGVILVHEDGRLTFVGRILNLHLKAGRNVWPPERSILQQLPAEAWAPETILLPGEKIANSKSRGFQCVSCLAPLGGVVVIIRGGCVPATNLHRDWFYCAAEPRTPLVGNAAAGLPLCAFCWNSLESPACLADHMGASLTHTTIPFSQAEAAAACPSHKMLAPLLAGTATPITGAKGAFIVKTPENGPGGGVSVILACEKMGRYPAVTYPAIAAAKLSVITMVLASVQSDPEAGD
jgi:hypothetical protein